MKTKASFLPDLKDRVSRRKIIEDTLMNVNYSLIIQDVFKLNNKNMFLDSLTYDEKNGFFIIIFNTENIKKLGLNFVKMYFTDNQCSFVLNDFYQLEDGVDCELYRDKFDKDALKILSFFETEFKGLGKVVKKKYHRTIFKSHNIKDCYHVKDYIICNIQLCKNSRELYKEIHELIIEYNIKNFLKESNVSIPDSDISYFVQYFIDSHKSLNRKDYKKENLLFSDDFKHYLNFTNDTEYQDKIELLKINYAI